MARGRRNHARRTRAGQARAAAEAAGWREKCAHERMRSDYRSPFESRRRTRAAAWAPEKADMLRLEGWLREWAISLAGEDAVKAFEARLREASLSSRKGITVYTVVRDENGGVKLDENGAPVLRVVETVASSQQHIRPPVPYESVAIGPRARLVGPMTPSAR